MVTACKANDILSTLFHVCKKHSSKYCYPSQKTILSLLERYHQCKISIATLNRWLRAIEDAGYIKRTRRIKKHPKLGMIFRSTMYRISKRGFYKLAMLGVVVKGWFKRDENAKKNHEPEPRSGAGRDPYLSGVAPLKDIVGGLLKNPVIAEHVGSSK